MIEVLPKQLGRERFLKTENRARCISDRKLKCSPNSLGKINNRNSRALHLRRTKDAVPGSSRKCGRDRGAGGEGHRGRNARSGEEDNQPKPSQIGRIHSR